MEIILSKAKQNEIREEYKIDKYMNEIDKGKIQTEINYTKRRKYKWKREMKVERRSR